MKGAGLFLMLVFLVGYLPASFSWALEPNEILVLANRNAAKSVALAKYYMERRGIPEKNLLPLRITDKEWCEREDYEKRVAAPVREHLKEKDLKREIRCILVLYGFPLKVAPPGMTENEKEEVASLQKRQEALKARIDQLKGGDSQDAKKAGEELEIIRKQISRLRKRGPSRLTGFGNQFGAHGKLRPLRMDTESLFCRLQSKRCGKKSRQCYDGVEAGWPHRRDC